MSDRIRSEKNEFNLWMSALKGLLRFAIDDLKMSVSELDLVLIGMIRGLRVEDLNALDDARRKATDPAR